MTEDNSERPRGFLTKTDREFLTTPTEELDVQQQTIRKRQDRIRERAYNAILDFELLLNLEHRQRERLFRNVRDNWMEDYHAVQGMFEFMYLGLLEQRLAGAFSSLLETSVRSATFEYGRDTGQFLSVDVECTIETNYKFDRDDPPEPNEEEVENSLIDEMNSAPSGMTALEKGLLGDDVAPTSHEEEVKNSIIDELHSAPDGSLDNEDDATPFIELLDDAPYVELLRPEDDSVEWDPTEDETLHEYIAMWERAREEGSQAPYGDRWEQLKKVAEFDPAEWGLEDEDNNASDSHHDVEDR